VLSTILSVGLDSSIEEFTERFNKLQVQELQSRLHLPKRHRGEH
jgi:hypothetical protein